MPLFTRISKWMASRRSDATVTVAPDSIVGTAAPFGVSVNNQAALKITALYAGIRIRSENIASFPKYVKKRTSEGLVDASYHPAFRVINIRPNSYTDKFDFWNYSVLVNGTCCPSMVTVLLSVSNCMPL